MLGAALFGFGAILSTIAPSYVVLLLFRLFQGFAAGMMEANFPALVTVSFPSEQRGKALGIASASIALSALVGVVASGLIIDAFGWRWIFIAVVPFCAAAVPLCHYLVPESKGLRAGPRDVRGSLLLLGSLATFAIFLAYGTQESWGSPMTIWFLSITGLFVILLYIQEKRHRTPLLPAKLLREPVFLISILTYLAVVTVQMLVYLTAPFFLDYYMGLTNHGAGFILVIALGATMLLLVPSGIAADFIGTRPLETAGIVMIAIGLGVLAFAGDRITMASLVVGLALFGAGGGLFASPNYSAIMGSVPKASLGVAGGIYGTVETMGAFFGFALSDAVLGRWADVQGFPAGERLALFNADFHGAIRLVFFAGFIVAIIALGILSAKYWSSSRTGLVPARKASTSF